jgi:hypothetical protein
MIAQEFTQEGKALPEGPEDSVEMEEVSEEKPRIAVTSSPWPSTTVAFGRLLPEN